MDSIVIYDLTGRILTVMYGETTPPEGIPYILTYIPNGAEVERVDVITDPNNPQVILKEHTKTEFDEVNAKLSNLNQEVKMLENNSTMSQYEVEQMLIDHEYRIMMQEIKNM